MLKACAKDLTEISKIVWKVNESLPNFKERWVSESNAIPNVPELMKISSFMSSHKCSKLSKRFSNSIPKTVDEMLKRVDDYVRSEEAFQNTELPKDEFQCKELQAQWGQRNNRPRRGPFENTRRKPDHRPTFRPQDHHSPYVAPHRPNQNIHWPREQYRDNRAILTLDSLGIETIVSQTATMFECKRVGKKQEVEPAKEVELERKVSSMKEGILKKNIDIFAWEPTDMMGVPKRIIKHTLNANPSVTLVSQKQRILSLKKSQTVIKGVAEWLKASIVRPVRYPTWISVLVLVKKADRIWRMYIDFKNNNCVCLKDYYPFLEIDLKIEAVIGFPLKCFLYAHKGYHQVQMAEKDEENTAFYTDQGTANQAKTKDIAEMKSPKPWGQMQNLSGKLAALNQDAEMAFQELNKTILNLPSLTTPLPRETLYIYLAASQEAINAGLLAKRNGEEFPVHYIKRHFEAHPMKVITDQPIKQIMSKAEASGKLAKYSIELGAYNIAYELRSAVKGQVSVDFINEGNTHGSMPHALESQIGRRKGHSAGILLVDHVPGCKGRNLQNLTFRSEAVIPAEIGVPTHQTMMIKEGANNEEEMWLNLDLLQERREVTTIREARYTMKMEHYYNKRVRAVSFKVGEYVYQKNEAIHVENLGKLNPKWEGPYLVMEAYQNGSSKLQTMDDREVPCTWHAINLRRCYYFKNFVLLMQSFKRIKLSLKLGV
nr:reverse transcriptase domain-containing protein [Tanacetum cinerariifolium]